MSANNTVASLNGLFKEVYMDKITDLVPDSAKLIKLIPMMKKEKLMGNQFNFPVIVSLENGKI